MNENLIVEDNTIYEIDPECLKKKYEQQKEQEKKEEEEFHSSEADEKQKIDTGKM